MSLASFFQVEIVVAGGGISQRGELPGQGNALNPI